MRFQDAATDARAVVYAGIQADPLVARTAALLADATPAQRLLARAVMNGETTDAGRLAGDVPDACSARRADRRRRRRGPVRGDPRRVPGGRRPRRAGPQPGPRRDRRGADRACSWRAGSARPRCAASGASCSTASGPRSTRTTSRSSATGPPRRTTASGARAASTPTSSTSSTTRATHAADEDERLTVALVVFDARRSCDVRLARQTAPHEATAIVTIETLDGLAAGRRRVTDGSRRADTCSARRTASASTRPVRTACSGPRSCCATRRTWPGTTRRARGFGRAWYAERGLTWLVRAAEVAVVGADPARRRARRDDPGRRLAARLGAAADRVP